MTTSSVIEALNAAGILPERLRAERVRSLTEQERGLFRWILTSFAAGAPPGADDLADAASELGLSVEPALERLRREDLVHHDPETGAILVAYPFSGRPAAHRVRFDGREAYAMCAIDALGIPFMLNVEAEIESRDPLADDAIRVEVDPSAGATWTPEGAVVIAASQAGGGPSCNTRCRYVNFFASGERARRYVTERPSLRAEVLSIPEAIEAGRIVFGSLLGVESRTAEEG